MTRHDSHRNFTPFNFNETRYRLHVARAVVLADNWDPLGQERRLLERAMGFGANIRRERYLTSRLQC
jgi:hypothetical protein